MFNLFRTHKENQLLKRQIANARAQISLMQEQISLLETDLGLLQDQQCEQLGKIPLYVEGAQLPHFLKCDRH